MDIPLKWSILFECSYGKIAHVTDNPSAEVHFREMKEAVAKPAEK